MKHAFVVGLGFFAQFGNAQIIRSEQDARHRAEQFLQEIGAQHSVASCKVTSRQERFGAPRTFFVEGENGSFCVVLWDETGQVVGYSDFSACLNLLNRTTRAPRVIHTQEQAWLRAKTFLQACGYASDRFKPKHLSPLADLPGAERDRNNAADRYCLRFVQTGYPAQGSTNDASVTFDVVTGKPLLASVSPYLNYEPPILRWSVLAVLFGVLFFAAKRLLRRPRAI